MLLVIFLLFSIKIHNIESITRCKSTVVGIICTGIEYLPEDLITDAKNRPVEISLKNIINDIDLKIPSNYHNTSQGVYSGFKILNSCVKSIEENFFANLDRMKNELKAIRFQNVKCLESLSTKQFIGIGKFLENLKFINLTNLRNIDGDFFNSFIKLKSLTITYTKINWIPETILKLIPTIVTLKINNNKLTKMPLIPSNNPDLIKNFDSFGNPFDCVCSLMDFIRIMDKKLSDENYFCETPENLSQTKLQSVPDLCTITTMTTKTVKVLSVTDAKVRIEIIAAVAVLLLIIVVIIIIVVVMKQKKKDPQEKVIYASGSPSKIVYQDESYKAFIQQQNQRV